MTGHIVSGTALKTMRISTMQRLRLNAILVTTTRNFIPFKLRIGRIYGMLSVGLDRELTKDLHLTSAFHNLFEHMEFAITDFVYVREFETEINIEIIKSV
jgi:hypothetical protein